MLARVFPRKTSFSPTDEHAYFDTPPMFPKYDEAHISVAFTWDIERGFWLQKQWQGVCKKVLIGGPAFDDGGEEFVPGRYLREGITITSRGCPNNCPFCFVPRREGTIRELPIVEGNIVQDNNLLACSRQHIDKVFQMLSKQKAIDFGGGLAASLITDEIVDRLTELRIAQIWLAYDHANADQAVQKAVDKLSKYFVRKKIRCYVLIGYADDTIEKATKRLERAWEIGTLPFAMLYKPGHNTREWKQFQRKWARPAAIKGMMQ